LGKGLIPRDLRDFPKVNETFRLKLQHRLVLELLVDSFTGLKTDTMEKSFALVFRSAGRGDPVCYK
jgi:hypothetical protein